MSAPSLLEPIRRDPRAGRAAVCPPAVRLTSGPVLLADLLPLLLERLEQAQQRQQSAELARKAAGR